MNKNFITIQIIPENSKGIKQFKIPTKWIAIAKIFLLVFIIIAVIFICHLGRINRIIVSYEKMRVTNAQLIKRDNNYKEMFSRLDSLWLMENKLQNIFETFIENDSAKINSIIDRNRFAYTPEEKITVDYEGINGWQPLEEKIRHEHIPSILPVVGLKSKKFSEQDKHLGVDFSASIGNPVFATASGVIEFANTDGDFGNRIIINHKNGYKSTYSHLKNFKVRKGNNVGKGDIIGTVGNTGNTSGSHLHYEIFKDGVAQNPEMYFDY